MRIKKDDIVKVLSGEHKGKSGKVLRIFTQSETALVQGINLHWKHMRKSKDYPHGARIQKETPIYISKIELVCPNCNKPAKVGYQVNQAGIKNRICRKCSQTIAES